MYRNFDPLSLGISGRQSELIELALTHGFRGVSADIVELAKRAARYSVEHACRFHKSAKVPVGTFRLPDTWLGSDEQFAAFLNQDLPSYIEIAKELEATQALVAISPGSDSLPYHENFELHRARLAQIADQLQPANVRLGLGLRAARPVRQDFAYQFIFQTDDLLTLIQSVAAPNVGLWLDVWNWKVGGGTLDQIRDWPIERLVAVDLADVSAELDLAEVGEEARVLPGQGGAIDCQAVVNLLAEREYAGPVTPTASNQALEGMTREEIVRSAASALEELWIGAGLARPVVTAAKEAGAGEAEPAAESEPAAAEASAGESTGGA